MVRAWGACDGGCKRISRLAASASWRERPTVFCSQSVIRGTCKRGGGAAAAAWLGEGISGKLSRDTSVQVASSQLLFCSPSLEGMLSLFGSPDTIGEKALGAAGDRSVRRTVSLPPMGVGWSPCSVCAATDFLDMSGRPWAAWPASRMSTLFYGLLVGRSVSPPFLPVSVHPSVPPHAHSRRNTFVRPASSWSWTMAKRGLDSRTETVAGRKAAARRNVCAHFGFSAPTNSAFAANPSWSVSIL